MAGGLAGHYSVAAAVADFYLGVPVRGLAITAVVRRPKARGAIRGVVVLIIFAAQVC